MYAKASPRLFDVKLRAIENLYQAGVDIVPVITIVNGVNNEQVGRVTEFALDNPRDRFLSVAGMALALMRNYNPFKAPTHFQLMDLMKKFDKTFGATGKDYGKVSGDRTMDDMRRCT